MMNLDLRLLLFGRKSRAIGELGDYAKRVLKAYSPGMLNE
jgi:hypothetical protein